jgi:hypothetical protein
MGCNSHMFVEIRHQWEAYANIRAGESWSLWGPLRETRDYNVYGALCGVRADWPKPVAPVRGLPANVGYDVKEIMEKAGADYHHHTWLAPKEFRTALERVIRGRRDAAKVPESTCAKIYKGGPYIYKPWIAAARVLRAITSVYGEENVRVVMAFDN